MQFTVRSRTHTHTLLSLPLITTKTERGERKKVKKRDREWLHKQRSGWEKEEEGHRNGNGLRGRERGRTVHKKRGNKKEEDGK